MVSVQLSTANCSGLHPGWPLNHCGHHMYQLELHREIVCERCPLCLYTLIIRRQQEEDEEAALATWFHFSRTQRKAPKSPTILEVWKLDPTDATGWLWYRALRSSGHWWLSWAEPLSYLSVLFFLSYLHTSRSPQLLICSHLTNTATQSLKRNTAEEVHTHTHTCIDYTR